MNTRPGLLAPRPEQGFSNKSATKASRLFTACWTQGRRMEQEIHCNAILLEICLLAACTDPKGKRHSRRARKHVLFLSSIHYTGKTSMYRKKRSMLTDIQVLNSASSRPVSQ